VRQAGVRVRSVGDDGSLRLVASGESDSRGLVHVCRAPRHALFVIAAEKDGAAGSASVTATNPLTTVRVRLAPP
jgi:hypothetical protein